MTDESLSDWGSWASIAGLGLSVWSLIVAYAARGGVRKIRSRARMQELESSLRSRDAGLLKAVANLNSGGTLVVVKALLAEVAADIDAIDKAAKDKRIQNACHTARTHLGLARAFDTINNVSSQIQSKVHPALIELCEVMRHVDREASTG